MSPYPMAAVRAKRGGQFPQFAYRVTVANGEATTPLFMFGAGAPFAKMDWGDGSALEAVTSGVELNHAYTMGGTYTVRLVSPNQAQYLTIIDISQDKLISVLTPIQMFPAMTLFVAYVNQSWVQDISSWRFVNGFLELYISNTNTGGDFGSMVLPASLVTFYLRVWHYIYPIVGCPVLSSMVAIRTIDLSDIGLSQTDVDLWLSRCVVAEPQTIYATPTLDLGGSNAAPSAQGLADKAILVAAGWTVTTH